MYVSSKVVLKYSTSFQCILGYIFSVDSFHGSALHGQAPSYVAPI